MNNVKKILLAILGVLASALLLFSAFVISRNLLTPTTCKVEISDNRATFHDMAESVIHVTSDTLRNCEVFVPADNSMAYAFDLEDSNRDRIFVNPYNAAVVGRISRLHYDCATLLMLGILLGLGVYLNRILPLNKFVSYGVLLLTSASLAIFIFSPKPQLETNARIMPPPHMQTPPPMPRPDGMAPNAPDSNFMQMMPPPPPQMRNMNGNFAAVCRYWDVVCDSVRLKYPVAKSVFITDGRLDVVDNGDSYMFDSNSGRIVKSSLMSESSLTQKTAFLCQYIWNGGNFNWGFEVIWLLVLIASATRIASSTLREHHL